jgi:hypothetical protein
MPSLFDASEIDAEEAEDAAAADAAAAAEAEAGGKGVSGLHGSAKEAAAALMEAIKQQHQRFKANGGLALTGVGGGGGGGGAAGGGAKAYREVDIATVTILFPLPAEDPLIHQRKAAELARALGNDQGELLSNVKTFDYDLLKRSKPGKGCEIIGKTRPELGLHALVKFNTVRGFVSWVCVVGNGQQQVDV